MTTWITLTPTYLIITSTNGGSSELPLAVLAEHLLPYLKCSECGRLKHPGDSCHFPEHRE